MKLCSSDSYYTLTPLRLSYWERTLKVGFPLKPKMLNLPFLFNITHHQKIESPHPSLWSRTTYWKKDISHSFRKIAPIILSVVLPWFIWKNSTELSVNKKQCAAGLCPRIIPAVSLFWPKISHSFNVTLLPQPGVDCPFYYGTFVENPGDGEGGETNPTTKHLLISSKKKKSLSNLQNFYPSSNSIFNSSCNHPIQALFVASFPPIVQ